MRENSKTKTKTGKKASHCKHQEYKLFVTDLFFSHLHGCLVYISFHSFYMERPAECVKELRNQPLTLR